MVFSMMQYLRLQTTSRPSDLLGTALGDLRSSFWRYPIFNLQAIIIECAYERSARELWDLAFGAPVMRRVVALPWRPREAMLPAQAGSSASRAVADSLLHAWGWSGRVPRHMEACFAQWPHTMIYFMAGLNAIHLLGDMIVAPFEAIMLRNIAAVYFNGSPATFLLTHLRGLSGDHERPPVRSLVRDCAARFAMCIAVRTIIGLSMTNIYASLYRDLERRRLAQVKTIEPKET